MKVFKPQRLSVLQRVVTHRRRHTLVVSVLAYVPFAAPRRLLTEQSLWRDVAEQVPGGIVDEGLPKPCGEVLASGHAHAGGGKPALATKVHLRVLRGNKALVDKSLAVWGNRYWTGNDPSAPVPFTSLPLDWAHAFGGPDFARNPEGKGHRPVQTEHGPAHPLPNVESPHALVVSRSDEPEPVSFGPYPHGVPQRFARLGKRYDQAWLEQLAPGPAEDFDPHFYCAGAPDQWLPDLFECGDRLEIEGMHPVERSLATTIEPLVIRVFVTQRTGTADPAAPGPNDASWVDDLRAFPTRLDTVHLLPGAERAVLVYRAHVPVQDDDADDIVQLLLAAEAPGQDRPLAHYQAAMRLRLDKDAGALATLKDSDLLPPPEEGARVRIDPGEMGELVALEHRKLRKSEKGRQRRLVQMREQLAQAGVEIEGIAPAFEPAEIVDPFDVDAMLEAVEQMQAEAAEHQREAEARKAALEADTRARFEQAGLDYDAEKREAVLNAGDLARFSADEHLVMLHDMARIAAEGGMPMTDLERDLTDPRYEEMLLALQERARQAYLTHAHLMPPSAPTSDEQGQMLRVRVEAAMEAGESLEGQNLIGADLHGLALRGLDLRGALLEAADLRGADLGDARLAGAVLVRARLEDTCLAGADLTGANLGGTKLVRTDLSGAVLDEAVFMRAELDGCVLKGAHMRETDFVETTFVSADLSQAVALQPLFLQSDLREVVFAGAQMQEARFLEVDVRGVDFTGAVLDRAQFAICQGDGARFAGARLEGAFFVHESSLLACSFAGANLRRANFYKTPLAGGDFEGATLHGANLSGCDLRRARLAKVAARGALMIRTDLRDADLRAADLLGSILQKARAQGADLRTANLCRADLSLLELDGETRLDDSLMLDARVDPRYQPPDGGPAGERGL